jgi:hypothetical protein
MKNDVKSVFISGVSSGIGFALATLYLSKGWTVYGLSRKPPQALMENKTLSSSIATSKIFGIQRVFLKINFCLYVSMVSL